MNCNKGGILFEYWGGVIVSLVIGIDYGKNGDKSVYTATYKLDGKYHMIDSGLIDDLDMNKYFNTDKSLKIVGEPADVRRFKKQFKM